MRARLTCAAAIAAVLFAASMAPAQTEPPAQSGNVCLRTIDIQNTTVPDNQTILFHMRDGKIWKNTLRNRCVGLRFNGFAYVATPPAQICGNLQTIRALETGAVCMLGPFTPYVKEKPAGGDKSTAP